MKKLITSFLTLTILCTTSLSAIVGYNEDFSPNKDCPSKYK